MGLPKAPDDSNRGHGLASRDDSRLNARSMSQMLKSAASVASATLVSRVLGLVREMAYARFMGTGWVASAFIFAFTIPNLFRRLLGEGALTAAFIPQFKAKEAIEGEAAMWRAANAVLSGLIVVAIAITAVAVLGITGVLTMPGLQAQTRLMLELLRIMFPYMIFVCLAAVCMGMLNARGRFFVPALGAALLNLVMIATVLIATRIQRGSQRDLEEIIPLLAIGVLVAGIAQAAFQVPSLLAEGWRFEWINPWTDPTVREVLHRMLPATVGVAAFQLNVLITQSFAFFLEDSIVASFQFAVRLMELPQGLFGASLGAYLLPALSGLAAEKQFDRFRDTVTQGLAYLLFINLLAAALLTGLSEPIVRLLFEGGRFKASDTTQVANALLMLAPGLVAFSSTNVLARAFHALGDTRIPMQISVFCLGVNVILSILFALPYQAMGLAIANTLTSSLNAGLLLYALRRKFPRLDLSNLRREGTRLAWGAALASLVAWALQRGWSWGPGSGTWLRALGAVAVPSLGSTLLYVALARWAGSTGYRDAWAMLQSRVRSPSRR